MVARCALRELPSVVCQVRVLSYANPLADANAECVAELHSKRQSDAIAFID